MSTHSKNRGFIWSAVAMTPLCPTSIRSRLWWIGKKSGVIATALQMIALLVLAGCEKKSMGPMGRPPVSVEVAKAISQDAPLYIQEIGSCTAMQSVAITPQVSGAITEIRFKDGQEVKTGDILFIIDPRTYQAAVEKAEATLLSDKATLTLNSQQLERNKSLVQGNFISSQDLDTLKTTVETNDATVKQDTAALETAKINLEYCTITSPINGKTGIHQYDIGNVVTSYATTPLLSIQRMDPLYVDFIVTEGDFPKVREYFKEGTLKVKIYPPNDESKSRLGDLIFVDNAVQQGTGTVKLRALLQNEDRFFWPGQFVKVKLVLADLKNSVQVPSGAVQISQTGPFLFVVKSDSTVELRPVTLGQQQGDNTIIEKGLAADETVVVDGQLMLSPGAKVIPINPASPAPSGTSDAKP